MRLEESEQDDSTTQAPEIDASDARLGPCGCVDYHFADCPLRVRSESLEDRYPFWDEDDYYYDFWTAHEGYR